MNAAIVEQLALSPCEQVGFVVRDMDAALAMYEPLFGPFTMMEPGNDSYSYRGKQADVDLQLAFGKSGDLEIELIAVKSGCSPHQEFLDSGREGMHHLRFRVDHLEPKVEQAQALGYENIWGKRFGEDTAVAYLVRPDDPLIIELLECPERTKRDKG
jgi:methylmalonyl-CoA/ethylmalonyl-CoA epimerase